MLHMQMLRYYLYMILMIDTALCSVICIFFFTFKEKKHITRQSAVSIIKLVEGYSQS